jgi:hypothetical protein
MGSADRIMHYQTTRIGYNTGQLNGLTPRQRRRELRKRGHQAAVRRRRHA